MHLSKEQRIALFVAVLTIALILLVSVFRNGTSW
jgi:hypothetical protein